MTNVDDRTSIDLHAHFAPQSFWDQIEKTGGDRIQVRRGAGGGFEFFIDGIWRDDMCLPELQDWPRRLEFMDANGIGLQVVSVTANPHVTWAEPRLGLELSRQINDELAWATGEWPGRIAGWAAVPLQDVGLAVLELERAKSIGLVGVQIPSHVGSVELDDPILNPFWEAAQSLDYPVFIHNQAVGGDPRVPPRLRHVVGAPMETTLAVTRLLFGGVPDRYPRIRFLLTHGGGALPYIVGRLDRGWTVMREPTSRLPSATLRGFWFDTVLHDPAIIGHLISYVGASQVVVGTDYPYPMGALLREGLPDGLDLTPEVADGIRHANAARFLGLDTRPAVEARP